MRILVVGAGRIGAQVLRQLQKNPSLTIITCDPNEEPFAVQKGIISEVDIQESLTPLTLAYILAQAKPDLILLARASEDTDAALIKDHFKGPSAVALSYTDPVAPAKVLSEFAKDNEKLEIKIGVMNGKALDLDGIKALAELPSREVLLAQVLSAMNAVPSSFVRTLGEIPRSFVNVLSAVKDQKEA